MYSQQESLLSEYTQKSEFQATFSITSCISAKVNGTMLIVSYHHLVIYVTKDPYDWVQQLAFGFGYLTETDIFI